MKKHILLEQCLNFLKSEEIKKEIEEIMKPIIDYIFKELSLYLYFFAFLIIVGFLLHLGVLILLIRFNKKLSTQ
tara:strand:+ start:619 stop:840 length:222 start_codon:yes stop_codon:yes gene_type:complete